MAGSVNKVILVGRLGKDPEYRVAASGKPVARFTLATDTGFGDKRTTDWHTIVTFDRLAELSKNYLNKGKQVYIEGRIQYRKWAKEDGNEVNLTEIIATELQFLGSASEGRSYGQSSYGQGSQQGQSYGQPRQDNGGYGAQSAPSGYGSEPGGFDIGGYSDEDIPF